MNLTLTEEQKKAINSDGFVSSAAVQRAFKRSVEDQQKTLKKAEKIQKSVKQ